MKLERREKIRRLTSIREVYICVLDSTVYFVSLLVTKLIVRLTNVENASTFYHRTPNYKRNGYCRNAVCITDRDLELCVFFLRCQTAGDFVKSKPHVEAYNHNKWQTLVSSDAKKLVNV